MRRSTAMVAVAVAIATQQTAFAQDPGPLVLTSLDPLGQVLDGFAADGDIEGLTITTDAESEIVSQFQFFVNFSGVPSTLFNALSPLVSDVLDEGTTVTPVGVAGDADPALVSLVSLETVFGGPLVDGSFVPPFDPWSSKFEGVDLSSIVGEWTAYDNDGPISGPVDVRSKAHAVWGMRLAEPFDPTCSRPFAVGRAWEGVSSSDGPDDPFTADALATYYTDEDRTTLAGRASRVVELACGAGESPRIQGSRMVGTAITESGNSTIALVNGDVVVFLSGAEMLSADLDQQYFVRSAAGATLAVFAPDDDLKVLVPNPYGPDDVRITLEIGGVEPADENAAAPAERTRGPIAFRGGVESSRPASPTPCTVWALELHLLQSMPAIQDAVIAVHWSIFGAAVSDPSGESATFTMVYPGGRIETVVVEQNGSMSVTVDADGNTCVVTGTATISAPIPANLGATPTAPSDEQPETTDAVTDSVTDSGTAATTEDPIDEPADTESPAPTTVPATPASEGGGGNTAVVVVGSVAVLTAAGLGFKWWWSRHTATSDPPAQTDSTPAVITGRQPPKDVKAGPDSPSLIGVRGTKL